MAGDLEHPIVGYIWTALGQQLPAYAQMDCGPLRLGNQRVCGLLNPVVDEAIGAASGRACGPRLVLAVGGPDQPRGERLVQTRFSVSGLEVCSGEERLPSEGVADARGKPQHGLSAGRQALDPLCHQRHDVVRRGCRGNGVKMKRPLSACPIERQQLVVLQGLQKLDHEEGIAVRLLTDQSFEASQGRLVRAQAVGEELQEARLVQRPQGEPAHTGIAAFEAISRDRQGMVGGYLVVAVRADDQQRSRVGVGEDRVQQFQRRRVDPLQVVEEDDQGMVGPREDADEACRTRTETGSATRRLREELAAPVCR